jgi:hypothetical protein
MHESVPVAGDDIVGERRQIVARPGYPLFDTFDELERRMDRLESRMDDLQKQIGAFSASSWSPSWARCSAPPRWSSPPPTTPADHA